MIAVVSPAKKLDVSPIDLDLRLSQPALIEETEVLMKTTRRLKPKDLQSLMGISEKLADLNHGRFQAFETPLTADNSKPA